MNYFSVKKKTFKSQLTKIEHSHKKIVNYEKVLINYQQTSFFNEACQKIG